MHIRHALGMMGALLLAGCGGVRQPAAPLPACAAPPAPAVSDQAIQRPAFSLRIPAGYAPEQVQGIDSKVERWSAGELRVIGYDLGPYSSTLVEMRGLVGVRGLRGYSECEVMIGGRPAKLVTGWDQEGTMVVEGRKYVAAASWRDIQPGLHLTVTATTPDAREMGDLLRALHSVTFAP